MAGETLGSWFWNDRFWLPSNVTWKDLENTDTVKYPHLEDFVFVIPCAFLLLFARSVVERYVAKPVANLMGVRAPKHRYLQPNAVLENAFQSSSKSSIHKKILGLAKQVDWSTREVERWLLKRRKQEGSNKLDKFTESFWRFLFYTTAFTYGAINIPKEDWFWDLRLCWHNHPFHPVSPSIFNLYFMELSFYLSLVISIFFDVRRKDVYAMFLHHISTIILITFSWVCNFTRIGCLIIVIHDISDIFLESAKVVNYAKMQNLAHVLFAGFAITFGIARIIYFPFWIFYSSTVHCHRAVGFFPSFFFFNGLLLFLLFLNIYWFSFIVVMVHTIAVKGKARKDIRSDDETDSHSSNENNHQYNDIKQNGKIGANGDGAKVIGSNGAVSHNATKR